MRYSALVLAALFTLLGAIFVAAQDTPAATESTLLVYSTVTELLTGDVLVGITIPELENELAAYPPTWAVVGIGTTTQPERNGELMPEGTADEVHYWWVDPSSETKNIVVDLAPVVETEAELAATPTAHVDFEPEFPFVALAIAEPEDALVFEVHDVENLHEWITTTLTDADIALAGLHVTGDFGAISTTVGYNLPPTGVDTLGVYSSTDYFHFIDYEPAEWTMTGFYAGDPDVQTVVSVAERPVHLHGYQPETMLGGHIASAIVENATLTVYPLSAVIQTRDDVTR